MNTDELLNQLAAYATITPPPFPPPALPADWTRPLALVEPDETTAIAEIVRLAEQANVALVPCGGGTQIHVGYPPRNDRPYLILRLTRCNRLRDYVPDDLTVTCAPGMTLAKLQATLAQSNQILALDVPLPERATLGGIVSANTVGLWRGSFGSPRDLLIGVKAVMAGGVEIHGGGRVVKNVAGYDVCKLFTGAYGTLGVLTELTFKVRARPAAQRTLAWETPDCMTAAKVGLALHHARLALHFVFATNEIGDTPRLLVGLEGQAARVDWQAEEIARRVAAAGIAAAPVTLETGETDALRNKQARTEPGIGMAARLSCLPAELPDVLAPLEAAGVALTADCMAGTLSLAASSVRNGFMQTILQSVPKNGGIVWQRPPENTIARWGETRQDFVLQRALKQALDPDSVFSPGRFVGKL